MRSLLQVMFALATISFLLVACMNDVQKAQWLFDQGKYEDVIAKYPDQPIAIKARNKIAEGLLMEGRYDEILADYNDTPSAARAKAAKAKANPQSEETDKVNYLTGRDVTKAQNAYLIWFTAFMEPARRAGDGWYSYAGTMGTLLGGASAYLPKSLLTDEDKRLAEWKGKGHPTAPEPFTGTDRDAGIWIESMNNLAHAIFDCINRASSSTDPCLEMVRAADDATRAAYVQSAATLNHEIGLLPLKP